MLRRPNKTGRRRTIDLALVLVVGAGEDGGAITNSEAQSLAALAKDSHRPRVLWQLWRCRRGGGTVRGDPPLLVQAAVPAEEDQARAVARAAEVRDGLLLIQDEVPVVDHVEICNVYLEHSRRVEASMSNSYHTSWRSVEFSRANPSANHTKLCATLLIDPTPPPQTTYLKN